jgi:putative membrane protein
MLRREVLAWQRGVDGRAIGEAGSMADEVQHRFDVRATADSHFSWLRTRLALESTLMSWVRTAVSLIGFGFTIVQFFERLQQLPGTVPARFPDAAWYLGLALILCGVASLVISLWDYRWGLRYLWSDDFKAIAGARAEAKQTPLQAVALALILVGAFAFFAVLLRLV